jgi:hypothetical protein
MAGANCCSGEAGEAGEAGERGVVACASCDARLEAASSAASAGDGGVAGEGVARSAALSSECDGTGSTCCALELAAATAVVRSAVLLLLQLEVITCTGRMRRLGLPFDVGDPVCDGVRRGCCVVDCVLLCALSSGSTGG